MRLNELMKPLGYSGHPINPNLGFTENHDREKIGEILDFISIHCSEALKIFQSSEKFLYRGIYGTNGEELFFLGKTPTDRMPQGQSKEAQQILDQILTLGGFTVLRKNSISTTSEFDKSTRWGYSYFIFTINGFTYTWSNRIRDIGSNYELNKSLNDFITTFEQPERKLNKEEAIKFIDNLGFKHDNLKGALITEFEVAIHGQYLAVNHRHFSRSIQKYFEINE